MVDDTSGKHKIIKHCGVVVKYNPCTRYARGSVCLYFRSKKCDELPLACQMPEYDKWYKDVLEGKRKCFYPNRIRLLENPGVPMFLFHVHHHAIVGEAQIVRSTTKNGKHFYWFDEFLSYPHPVQLELLEIDPRLPRLVKKGRWTLIYISEETIEKIRSLSRLPVKERKKLGKHLAMVVEQLKILPLYKPTWRSYMQNECEKLRKRYGLNEQVLAETQKHFSTFVKKKLSKGSSLGVRFYASLYLAFRMLGIPKPLKDIARISGISSTQLGKGYRLFARELNLTVPPLNPKQLIKSRSGKLNISKNTIARALFLVEEARKRRIVVGRSPSSIAAVAMFVACKQEGEEETQKQIAETFGVSEATIRNFYEKLETLHTQPR